VVSVFLPAVFLAGCANAVAPRANLVVDGPQAWIDAPLSGEVLDLANAPFEVVAHANDSHGLGSMEFGVNGQALESSDVSSDDEPYFQTASFEWQPPAPGDYRLTITAYDSLGNPGAVAAASVIVLGGGAIQPTLEETPTSSATEVAGACTFTAAVNLFCRSGPGGDYPDIDSFTPGVMAPVVGMSSDGDYWYVLGPLGGRMCTVPTGDRFGSTTGDCSQQPVFTPMPPPPTVTPSPTACPPNADGVPTCPAP
jgi:hypothetical protein